MTMSRKFPSRGLRTVALLVGFAGATIGGAGAAVAAEPAAAVVPPGTTAPAKSTTKQATAIAVIRTGGISGDRSIYALAGKGGNKQSLEAYRLASSAAFLAVKPRYVAKNACCDRFSYQIEVGYSDGTKKKLTVLEGTPGTPKVVNDLIRAVTSVPPPKIVMPTVPKFPAGFPFS
ncbi:hypothetical protein [Actinoplanes sp. NPDC051851]|uniref:hypothetical protein n=1 Tax=Actinoplanes sp. NPDC051851 TaxID=3154753 RepID=UPI0034221A57